MSSRLSHFSPAFAANGYQIHRHLFEEKELELLRREAQDVAQTAGSACVRHLGTRSVLFAELPQRPPLEQLIPHAWQRVRSILFDKTAAENWPVAWHQDLTIAVNERVDVEGYDPWSVKDGVPHVQPPVAVLEAMITMRVHLDDTPISNGALWVIPGSHRSGKLTDDEFAKALEQSAVTCECAAGDVLLMSPLLLHSSKRSQTPAHRRVLHYEYASPDELDARLDWRLSQA